MTEISLAEIFFLNPEIKKGLHPNAVLRNANWLIEVFDEISQLTTDEKVNVDVDLDTYLNDADKALAKKYMQNILEWRHKCTNIVKGSSHAPYDTSVNSNMRGLKALIVKAYKARAEKLEAEEKDRQWEEAHKAVNPPLDDAERYLNDEEYDSFIKAAREAIEVYIEKKKDYLNDSRTFDYRWSLRKINGRKEEERQKIAANFAAQEYNRRLNEEKARLKALLCPNEKDLKSYFKKEIQDRRYTGENFIQFLSGKEKRAFDNTIVEIGRGRLHKLVSNDFCEFVDGKYYRRFFLLPSAEYSFEGVPCLDFVLDVFAVVEARVWLKPRQKTFGDYVFKLPWREEKGCSVLLQEPEFLGYDYVVLTPKDIGGYVPWESIPLILILGLMNGELQPAGTTILATSENGRTYRIKNFKEEVTITRSFENYLKKIGSIEQMVSLGIVSQEVANVIKENLGPSSTEQRTRTFQNGQAVGFTDEELISSLTSLGHTRKTSEELCSRVPRNLSLNEAIEFALQKHSEIIAQQHSMKSQ